MRPYRSGGWPCRNGAAHRASTLGPHCAGRGGRSCSCSKRGIGFCGPQEEESAGSVSAWAVTAEPSLKFSVFPYPALDSGLARLPQAKIRWMFTPNVKLRGAEPPRTSSRHWSKAAPSTRPSQPIRYPVRISHCSVRMARDSCTSSRFSTGTAPGSGGNCLDRPLLSFAGPVSGSTALRSCRWTSHLLRSWTTTETWSGASSSFTPLTYGCIRQRAERDCAAVAAAGSTSNYDLSRGRLFAMAVANKEWWNENLQRPPSSTLLATRRRPQLLKMVYCTTCSGAQRRPNCLEERDLGSLTRLMQASGKSKDSHKGRKFCDEFNSTAGCPQSTSECPDLCKALRLSLPGALVPPPPLPPTGKRVGQTERGRSSKWHLPSNRSMGECGCVDGMRDTRESRVRETTVCKGGPSNTRVCVLPGPTSLAFDLGGQRGEQADSPLPYRKLKVAFVSLYLLDTHLDEQDVADDVWSLLRHHL